MKLKVKIKVLTEGCMPEINPKGDCIDLKSAVDMELPAPQSGVLKKTTKDGETVSYRDVELKTYHIPLGVIIQLPKGFKANVYSRSSGPSKKGLMIPNGVGIIDNPYCGPDDEWKYICTTMRHTSIEKGDKICQFEICLSQKANIFNKLKWLFCNGIELIEVDGIDSINRGGIGSTGVK